MYIGRKVDVLRGPARIERGTFSKSGQSVYYRKRRFEILGGQGHDANYLDSEAEERYWISGCERSGGDRLYPGLIEIDSDVREEYWTVIRGRPEDKDQTQIRCAGKHGGRAK
jgi:hypothetical protein